MFTGLIKTALYFIIPKPHSAKIIPLFVPPKCDICGLVYGPQCRQHQHVVNKSVISVNITTTTTKTSLGGSKWWEGRGVALPFS